MNYINDKQSKRIDELFRLLMIPDLSGSCWYLKQIYLEESKNVPNEYELITIVFVDKIDKIMLKFIDINGNEVRG
jgi:hypothetical protein